MIIGVGVQIRATQGKEDKALEELLGKRRRLREAFSLQSCKGSVRLKDDDGKVYEVNTTEINVNIKPSSIELIGM